VYAADAPPIIALKRKHDLLQAQHIEVSDLLSQLKSVSQDDAYKLLRFFREHKDVHSTLQYAQTLPAPGGPAEQLFTNFRAQNSADGSLTSVPYSDYTSNTSAALDLNSGRDRYDRVPRLADFQPALPSFRSLVYVTLKSLCFITDRTVLLSTTMYRPKDYQEEPESGDLQVLQIFMQRFTCHDRHLLYRSTYGMFVSDMPTPRIGTYHTLTTKDFAISSRRISSGTISQDVLLTRMIFWTVSRAYLPTLVLNAWSMLF